MQLHLVYKAAYDGHATIALPSAACQYCGSWASEFMMEAASNAMNANPESC